MECIITENKLNEKLGNQFTGVRDLKMNQDLAGMAAVTYVLPSCQISDCPSKLSSALTLTVPRSSITIRIICTLLHMRIHSLIMPPPLIGGALSDAFV